MGNYQGLARFGIAFDISFLFDIIYISVFFIFMCQCVYFMLLLLYMFKNLKKKMNILCIFYVCRYLMIFLSILPIRCFLDPCRYFADTDIFNTGRMAWTCRSSATLFAEKKGGVLLWAVDR